MSFSSHKENDYLVVTIEDVRLDAVLANPFKDYMIELMKKGQNNFILDLSKVSFMDSSGLGAVVAVRKELQSAEGENLFLASPQPAVSDLFDLTCMDKVFNIYDSVNDALVKNK